MRLGGQTLTVINFDDATEWNGIGDPILGNPTLTTVNYCSVQEHRTTRDINLTDTVEARYRIFTPPSAPLTSKSQVVVGVFTTLPLPDGWPLPPDGPTVFLVDGEPAVWAGFNGQPDHIECYIKGQVG